MELLQAPEKGLWRIGRSPDPFEIRDAPSDPREGNRFDSLIPGDFGVLYFGTTLSVCYGETLAPFRPATYLMDLLRDEWSRNNWMDVGCIPAAWRERRLAVRVRFSADSLFVDMESPVTHRTLMQELAGPLARLGCDEVDVSVVRGHDRRVTRLLGYWVASQVDEHNRPAFAGIRYLSRLDTTWECWAVFSDAPWEEQERRPILKTDTELQEVARHYGLTIH